MNSFEKNQISGSCRLFRTGDALYLDDVLGVSRSSRVDQGNAQSLEVDGLRHQITRRARDVREDCARRSDEGVEQARFAHVRFADDGDVKPLANDPPPPRRREERLRTR